MVQVHEPPAVIDYYIGANVEVAPDVVIAAGAVLEAAPGARLVVASGVCVGAGVIVQAAGGKLVIGAGASLGVGVLIFGQGVVNAHVCIGAESTLINPQIEAGAVIAARSLLGMPDAPPSDRPPADQNGHAAPPPTADSPPAVAPETAAAPAGEPPATPAEAPADVTALEESPAPAKIVYGRDQVSQLMKTLFPHRDALNHHDDSNGTGS